MKHISSREVRLVFGAHPGGVHPFPFFMLFRLNAQYPDSVTLHKTFRCIQMPPQGEGSEGLPPRTEKDASHSTYHQKKKKKNERQRDEKIEGGGQMGGKGRENGLKTYLVINTN